MQGQSKTNDNNRRFGVIVMLLPNEWTREKLSIRIKMIRQLLMFYGAFSHTKDQNNR